RQIGMSRMRSSMRGLNQHLPQPAAAFPGLPTVALPRTLMVAGTHPRPGGQMVRTRKAPHVMPNLGQDDFGGAPAHARNGLAQPNISFRLVEPLLECGRKSFKRLVQIFHMAEMRCEENGMMGPQPSDQRLFERIALTP